jgi:hypothetical protein
VWLRLHQCLAAAITNKWAGKFKVEECVKPLAYCLVLPPRVRIYYVFHMVFLKKFVGEPPGRHRAIASHQAWACSAADAT